MNTHGDKDSDEVLLEKVHRTRLPLNDYLYYIRRFVEIGDVLDVEKEVAVEYSWMLYNDPILGYLGKLMNDPVVQAAVLSSKLAGQIFYETVGRFVAECLHAEDFANQRFSTERKEVEKVAEWSIQKKESHWQSLLSAIDEKHHDDGFDIDFMKKQFQNDGWMKPENWEKLQQEWMSSIDERARKEVERKVKAKESGGGFSRIFQKLGDQIRSQGASETEALQAWNMMNGQWIESEFEKKLHIVQIQNKYPQIGEVVRKMGRLPDEDGKANLTIQIGFMHKLDHSAGSDIEGVTVGRDLNALMPAELAQYIDSELEGLFLRKWVTNRLQVFRYKSEITKPARRLRSEKASRRGPMIVCVDSSASMYGVPQRIEASLLSKLEQTAEQLERDCFLIDFSVGIRPIELRSRRKQKALERMGVRVEDNENFEKGYFPFIGGGTDAQKMLNMAFALLDNGDDRYMNADVLWITDFLIPRTTEDLMRRFKEYQKTGTRFYGFKIGEGQSNWDQYFDKIYEIHYRPPRLY